VRSLTDEEVDFIREDIRRRGVFTESLQEDLLDHLCCYIEAQPGDGRPFGEIYRQAVEAFGHNGLQQVQDETLFLINNKHLTTMKKLMYISGAFASITLIAGAFFKLHHWPGTGVLLLSGITIMALLFAPSLFYLRYKEASGKKDRAISLIAMACAVVLVAGALLKIFHWPGANPVLFTGIISFFFVFLPLYMINGFRNPATRFSSLGNGLLLASTGGILVLLMFHRPSHAVETSLHAIEENEIRLQQQLETAWTGKSAEPGVKAAMNAFVASCAQAHERITEAAGNDRDHVGSGPVIDAATLDAIENDLDVAISALNLSLSKEASWTAIPPLELHQTTAGDLHFQLVQLENLVYSRALGL
jgi:hypothetical protein